MKEILDELDKKINEEKQKATKIESKLRKSETEINLDVSDSEFYKDVIIDGKGYTNIPNGVKPIQFLYSGKKIIYDLSPEKLVEIFNGELGISAKDFKNLVDSKVILPSVWVRNLDDWKNSGFGKYFEKTYGLDEKVEIAQHIISKGIVLGERADAIMRLKSKNKYDDYFNEYKSRLKYFFNSYKRKVSFKDEAESTRLLGESGLTTGLAKRWAYLKVFKPAMCNEIDKLFNSNNSKSKKEKLRRLSVALQMAKYNHISVYTGTPGEAYTFSKMDLDNYNDYIKELKIKGLKEPTDAKKLMKKYEMLRNYLIAIRSENDDRNKILLEILTSRENLLDIHETLLNDITQNIEEIDNKKISELEKAHKEITSSNFYTESKKSEDKYKTFSDLTNNIYALSISGFSYLTNLPLWLSLMSFIITFSPVKAHVDNWYLKNFVKLNEDKLEENLIKFINNYKYRGVENKYHNIFVNGEKLKYKISNIQK